MAISVKGGGGITFPNKQVLVDDSSIENDLYIENKKLEANLIIQNSDKQIVEIQPYKGGYITLDNQNILKYFDRTGNKICEIILPSWQDEYLLYWNYYESLNNDHSPTKMSYLGKKLVVTEQNIYIISIQHVGIMRTGAISAGHGMVMYCHKIELQEDVFSLSTIAGTLDHKISGYSVSGIQYSYPIQILSNYLNQIQLFCQYITLIRSHNPDKLEFNLQYIDLDLSNYTFSDFDGYNNFLQFDSCSYVSDDARYDAPSNTNMENFKQKNRCDIILYSGNSSILCVNKNEEIVLNHIEKTGEVLNSFFGDIKPDKIFIYNNEYCGCKINSGTFYKLNTTTNSWEQYIVRNGIKVIDIKLNPNNTIRKLYCYNNNNSTIYVYNTIPDTLYQDYLYEFIVSNDLINNNNVQINDINMMNSIEPYGIYIDIFDNQNLYINSKNDIYQNGVIKND